jgi:hypothetical protein
MIIKYKKISSEIKEKKRDGKDVYLFCSNIRILIGALSLHFIPLRAHNMGRYVKRN